MTDNELPGKEALRGRIEAAAAAGEPLAIGVLDLDRFDAVNKELGHEAGDRVLAALSALLSRVEDGAAYRFSGDEFAVALPGRSLEQAFLRMETLRARLEAEASGWLPDSRPITATFGVAQLPRDAKDAEGLFRAADAALAAVKEQGRNAVGLPPTEEMVMKSCYYPAAAARRLKLLAERTAKKESVLLREALSDLLHKYDTRVA